MKRAVITGLGIVSSIGNNQQEVLASLQEGRSGITFSQELKDSGMRSHVWGDVKLDTTGLIDRKVMRFMSDASVYAYLSMEEAIKDSGLAADQVSNDRTGLVVGSGGGSPRNQVAGSDGMRAKGLRGVGPYMVTKAMASGVSACLATPFKIRGVNYSISSACATSAHCIGHAVELIQLGKQDVVFAGGGEELGGLRAVKHYMQRTAIQGSPTMLAAIGQQWVRGAQVVEDRIHPFRKYFEEIQPGDSLLTPRRTLTEADIVNFACLSGDHFYAHMDKIAAAESIFGERVVHGYFLISAAAGLFVDAGVGPVIANYGMENLRFIEPVKPGDTIQVRLTCKRKTVKHQRSAEEKATGVVEWAVEIFNQHQQAVALYSILTLVARQRGDFAG